MKKKYIFYFLFLIINVTFYQILFENTSLLHNNLILQQLNLMIYYVIEKLEKAVYGVDLLVTLAWLNK